MYLRDLVLIAVRYFLLLQHNLVENLARDWFVVMRLLDQYGSETNFSMNTTASFEGGYATFHDFVFPETEDQMVLELTVEGTV